MKDMRIDKIRAREILDSRGNPTVEADVILKCGAFGRASVPSGASTGAYEAVELRDGGSRYMGMGVSRAVKSVNQIIAPGLYGRCADEQRDIDHWMLQEDGTENKSNLGANGMLAVSLAVAKAAAYGHDMPLYRYLGGCNAQSLLVPMMNVLNGGHHADSSLNIQECMIVPVGFTSFRERLEAATTVFHHLKNLLTKQGYSTAVGDDLFVTNTKRIQKGIQMEAANAVLIKVNQIGTLSETMDAIRMTKENGWRAIVSHRSGETEDTTIADIISYYE